MSMSDPIADMLTRIRNAARVAHPDVSMPSSRMKVAIAGVLKDEGYITDFEEVEVGKGKKDLRIELKYFEGAPVIDGMRRVSKPSMRVYKGKEEMPRVLGGLGISIVSTPNGVITGKKAKSLNVGGEVLCYVW